MHLQAKNFFKPPLASSQCYNQINCTALNRVSCITPNGGCGGCLPLYGATDDNNDDEQCYARLDATLDADGMLTEVENCPAKVSGLSAAYTAGATPESWVEHTHQFDVMPDRIMRVEVTFAAIDSTGEETWSWNQITFRPWGPPKPPQYSWELYASSNAANGNTVDVLLSFGTQNTPAGSVFLHDPSINSFGPVNGVLCQAVCITVCFHPCASTTCVQWHRECMHVLSKSCIR